MSIKWNGELKKYLEAKKARDTFRANAKVAKVVAELEKLDEAFAAAETAIKDKVKDVVKATNEKFETATEGLVITATPLVSYKYFVNNLSDAQVLQLKKFNVLDVEDKAFRKVQESGLLSPDILAIQTPYVRQINASVKEED